MINSSHKYDEQAAFKAEQKKSFPESSKCEKSPRCQRAAAVKALFYTNLKEVNHSTDPALNSQKSRSINIR